MKVPRRKSPTIAQQAATAIVAEGAGLVREPGPPRSLPLRFPPRYDTWEMEDDLEHIGRILAPRDAGDLQPASVRIDAAHPGPGGSHFRPSEKPAPHSTVEKTAAPRLLHVLTWLSTLLGTMGVSCGAVLLAWAAWSGRQELWRLGIPIGLGGLAVLAVGLIDKLDHLVQRRAA